MNILVTGGAGYIGSVAVKKLIETGNKVVVIDNLSKGKKELVDKKAKFYKVDLTNKNMLNRVFEQNKIDVVIHFAAYKAVEESMQNAVKYSDNIIGSINLLNAMVKHKVKKVIFSSTAAVYGEQYRETIVSKQNPVSPIAETAETFPVNFYGFAKLQVEMLIEWYNKIHDIRYICLRYFNVAGDGGLNYIDPDAQNVLPIIAEVIQKKRDVFTIFGDNYETRDGTCIRDYIHVLDLVDAHILAMNSNYNGVLNLGSSKGVTVKELVKYTEEIIGQKLPIKIGVKRAGDPGVVLASNKLAKEILNWTPKYNIKEMITSTLDSYKKLL